MTACVLLPFLGDGSVAAFQDYEQTPIFLDAKDVLAGTVLKGQNYQVVGQVKNDGLINTFQVKTDHDEFTVESTAALMIRIKELKALSAMEELDRKGVFGDAVVEGAKAPIKGAVALVTSPVETSKDIAKGTGRFLSNLGRSIFSDDPDQDNALKVALGYDTAKRQFAYEFGIDPYSSFEPAMDRLGEIARAAVAGGLAPRAVMASVDHDLAKGMLISATAQGMRKLVRDNPPGELRKINQEKLVKMGVPPSLAEDFVNNHRFNPQEETFLVGELESMKGVKGREVFIGKAHLAANKSIALYDRVTAQMMAGYYANVDSNIRIVRAGGPVGLQKEGGVLVFLAPIDRIFWTEVVEGKLNKLDTGIQKMAGVTGKELWITGSIDKKALKYFEAKGWEVKENANDILLK
jgi:hypothetical protein